MIKIVLPMAGRGSRFANAGYTLPKPLIPIHGHPMVEYVIRNITPEQEHQFIFLCLKEHLEKYPLETMLNQFSPGCRIVQVPSVTDGAASTVLLAKQYIDTDEQLMIANSDQYVDININEYLASAVNYDGLIMTMQSSEDKWSFIQYNDARLVTFLREKEVISNEATVGIYNFKHGRDFIRYSEIMIERNLRVNNEFYVAPVYNIMINDGKRIGFHNIGSVQNGMYGLGVPEDLDFFINLPLSHQIFLNS